MNTTKLEDFGVRERRELIRLLQSWDQKGLPEGFDEDEVTAEFNPNSGEVFLVNSEYQVCMMNGTDLEIWHNCGNCGHEGFEEVCQLTDKGCNECQ